MPSRTFTAFAAFLLVASLIAGVATVAAQDDRVDIDADHPLTEQKAIDEYQRDGVVSANLTRVDATLTISETSSGAGMEGFAWDFNNDFVCIDYRDLPRTVRVYIPAEYVEPRPKADLQSSTSAATADLEPTANRKHTAMTIQFDHQQRACFALSKEAGVYFDVKDEGWGIANNSTGWEIPRLGGGESQWQHVDDDAFVDNTTVRVPVEQQSITMQYDASTAANESTWLEVPGCTDVGEQSVCRFTRDNETDVVYLMSTDADPPAVRYKQVRDPTADVKAWAEDLKQVPSRIMETIDRLFGGGN